MLYLITFSLMALIPFAVGFAMMGLFRRRWTPVPVAVIVLYLGIDAVNEAMAGNGSGTEFRLLLAWFFILGASTGIASSNPVFLERVFGLKNVPARFAIPVVLMAGFGFPVAFYSLDFVSNIWRMSSPGPSCFVRRYAARIGNVDLSLPAAPGVTIVEKEGRRNFGLWHNPDLRYLCSRGDDEKLEIQYLTFTLNQSVSSTRQAKDVFCARAHPEYPWAQWACYPNSSNIDLPDRPSSVTVEAIDPVTTPRKSKPLPETAVEIAPDGSRIYRSADHVVVVTSAGDQVECSRIGRDWGLYCTGEGTLSEGLAISYAFWSGPNKIERTIQMMATAAREYVRSVTK